MILPVVNRPRPVPVFLFHVVALLPFIMTNVGVVMIVGMILGKRHGPKRLAPRVVTARIL